MPKRRYRQIIISIVVLLFLGAGLPKMYAGSVLLSRRISLTIQKQSIDKVLRLVEKKAHVQFMYNPQMFNLKQTISVQIQNSTLQELLQTVINNKELVFYEMGNYIVITNKLQAPIQANVVAAFLTRKDDKAKDASNHLVVDTIHFYDTIPIIKNETIRNIIQDTIKVYDTITKVTTKTVLPTAISTTTEIPESINSLWFAQAAFAPLYGNVIQNSNWKGNLSNATQAMVGVKMNHVRISIGLEAMMQHGSSKSSQSSNSTDSVLQRDTIHVMQKYKTGDYYSIVGKDTIHKVIYDSALVAVPQKWYNKTQHEKVIESIVIYSIYWIIIPFRIEYEWPMSKKMTVSLGLSVSPAFAIKKYGQIYSPQRNTIVSASQAGISSFTVFSSFEPSFSFALTKTVSVQLTPVVQCSLRSLIGQSVYYVGGGAWLGIRKSF